MADRILQHRVVGRQNRAARIAEDVRHAFAHQTVPEDFRTGQTHVNSPIRASSTCIERFVNCDAPRCRSRRFTRVADSRHCAPDADDTSRAYFASTPALAFGAGAVHLRRRSAISPAGRSRSRRRAPSSTVIVSPSRTTAIGPPGGRFGRHVAHHQSACGAGEPAVGHERHVVAQARAHDRRRDAEHLAHARSALRPFVANDDDVAGLDVDRLERPRTPPPRRRTPAPGPRMAPFGVSGDLHDRAIRREAAAENGEAAGRLERFGERTSRPCWPGVSLAASASSPIVRAGHRDRVADRARRWSSSRWATSALPPAR